MKILHSSDWHIGRLLYTKKRYDEFEAFLDWLVQTIEKQGVEALVVAGDIFDTSTPSNRAQEIYYRFLCRVSNTCCRHVLLTAGNHDSPSFLNAPRELLKALRVHVVGAAGTDPADEVLLLRDAGGKPELILCAVPYLRDRDLRTAEAGEALEDKERKLIEGLRSHYQRVCERAEELRATISEPVPILATGHLFAAGGRTIEGDGVRELYVGSLAHVSAQVFPACIDYLALGHLHVAQKLGGSETRRYSGSPLPMGFGEALQCKTLCLVDFSQGRVQVETLEVPVFQRLERLRGGWDEISRRIKELAVTGQSIWLEIHYEGEEPAGALRERLDAAVAQTALEILRIKNTRMTERVLSAAAEDETLDDLDVHQVFARCLDAHEVPEEQRMFLLDAYSETLQGIRESDTQAG